MFIRLAMCNLACSFCDTYFSSGTWMTIEEIEIKLHERWGTFYDTGFETAPKFSDMALIITGGEPSLQNILPLCEEMHEHFKYVQIESNGIIMPRIPIETILVVSPKCLEKNGKAVKYLMPNSQVLERANCLKFVISSEEDSPYHTIPDWAIEWKNEPLGGQRQPIPNREIYISPMNMYLAEPQAHRAALVGKNSLTLDERSVINEVISFWEPGLLDMKANQENHQYAAKYCVQNGLKLSLQQHLYVSMA